MKSLNFREFREKLISGEKKQTIRCKFIPGFAVGEIIKINFEKKTLFQAKIKSILPKLMKDITEEEAIKDGFLNRKECLKKLKEINKIKTINRYCFIIKFEPIFTITDFIYSKVL